MRLDYGYIIIPDGVDRDNYVETSLNRERVSIFRVGGKGILKDCYIDRLLLQQIIFPKTNDDIGSLVVYFQNSKNKKPSIISIISKENESQLLKEHAFSLNKSYEDNQVRVSGNAKDGVLFLNVDNTEGSGDLIIDVTGDNDNGNVKINCNGMISTYSKGSVAIETGGTLTINGGSEPILLGDTTQASLDALQEKVDLIINAIENGVPALGSSDGGTAYQSTMKTILTAVIDADFSNIKSDISFTD